MKFTLGRLAVLSLAKARERARAELEKIAAGTDPRDERRARRTITLPGTVDELCDRYVDQHLKPKVRRWRAAEGEIDNHTNLEGFYNEGEEIRSFLAAQDNMIVICGDRHYQYVIEDAETGLREFATGPASDAHARGWRNDDVRPEHRYLNVIGGFVAVTAERRDGIATLLVRHYSVDGEILNEEIMVAE